MTALYSFILFFSAALLFCIQPMVAKRLLPMLGGTPQVWNTCMVFFQMALLASYAYVHMITSRLSLRRQALAHGLVILLALGALFSFAQPGLPPSGDQSPVLWLLRQLLLWVGLPFFAVSATAPLLQSWYSRAREARSADPYFLYGASNAGSFVGLLMYPFFLERYWTLQDQWIGWRVGFFILLIGLGVCGVLSIARSGAGSPVPSPASEPAPQTGAMRPWRWVLLAFVPSSWMLSVTTYLTTDIASIPLFWVIPLALYLFTFVWAFSERHDDKSRKAVIRWMPILLLPVVCSLLIEAKGPFYVLIPLHLLAFFLGALMCHQTLAAERPPVAHLAEYYLWISWGGALGGIVNALVAPRLFSDVFEYPLILIAACAFIPRNPIWEPVPSRRRDIVEPLLLTALTWGLTDMLSRRLAFGIAIGLAIRFIRSPLRLILGMIGLFLVAFNRVGTLDYIIHRERTFFGVYKVSLSTDFQFRKFIHGTTLHGIQSLRPMMMDIPNGYYHREGPIGQLFERYGRSPQSRRVAVVGLGTGTLLHYAHPGSQWTFYEIDPAVERIARNPKYFTFLKHSPVPFRVITGDARLSIQKAPPAAYSMMIIDAFGSDAIPVHLLTREAMELYFSKLEPGGLLIYHVSNRHMNLTPVLGSLARALHLTAIVQDFNEADNNVWGLKYPSNWVVLARSAEDITDLINDSRWKGVEVKSSQSVWTDEYSNILTVLN